MNNFFKNILSRLTLRICYDFYNNLIICLYINYRRDRVYRNLIRYINIFQLFEINDKVFIIFKVFFLIRVYLRNLY